MSNLGYDPNEARQRMRQTDSWYRRQPLWVKILLWTTPFNIIAAIVGVALGARALRISDDGLAGVFWGVVGTLVMQTAFRRVREDGRMRRD